MALIENTELGDLEGRVVDAIDRRDLSALRVVGIGEISLALGWPTDTPTVVAKRLPGASATDAAAYLATVERYLAAVRSLGIDVVDTEMHTVDRGDATVAYLVQPLLDPDSLGDRLMGETEPDPDHPLLVGVAEQVATVGAGVSIDAQYSNWSLGDHGVTLLDVGTPFLWADDGEWQLDIGPFLSMYPAPLRPILLRELTKLVRRWQDPRAVANDVVANLARTGHENWRTASIESFRRAMPDLAPPTIEEAEASWAEDLKTFPLLNRLQKVERAWQQRVRRRRYDTFIQSSFDGTTN